MRPAAGGTEGGSSLARFAVDALGVLGALALASAAWLFVPRAVPTEERGPAVHAILLDASASVRRQRPEWPRWARALLRSEAERALEAEAELALIVYAAGVRRVFGPDDPRALLARLEGRSGTPLVPSEGAGSDGASRLRAALEVAEGLVLAAERERGELILAGPGTATDGDPNPALARLQREVRVRLQEVPPPGRTDVGIVALELPRTAPEGAPLEASAVIHVSRGEDLASEARLEVEVFEDGALRFERTTLPLAGWEGARRVSLPLGPVAAGTTRVNASVRLVGGGDPIPENDTASALTTMSEARVLGVLRGPESPDVPGVPAGIARVDCTLDDLAGLLPSLDAVVTLNVSHADLEERVDPALLTAFVREGGGWLTTGGRSFLYGWTESAAERGFQARLPLRPDVQPGDERDVILLLDGSQSMEGAPFDAVRDAAVDLVEAAGRRDEVRLRFFTAALSDAELLKERNAPDEGRSARARAARVLLDSTVPRGDTHIMEGLERLLDLRSDAAPPALVFLLTDGREMQSAIRPFPERGEALREALRERRVRVVPVLVGDRVERKYVEMFVDPGQPIFDVRELDQLGGLFQREVGGNRIVEAPPGATRTLSVRGAPGGLAEQALGSRTPPPIERFLRARARPDADVAWVDQDLHPVLALRREGRGRVAQLTTSLEAGWATAWTVASADAGWGPLGPLLRWLTERPPSAEDGPRAWLDGEVLHVTGLPPGLPARIRARIGSDAITLDLELDVPERAYAEDFAGLRERVARLTDAARAKLLGEFPRGTASLAVELGEDRTLPLAVELGPAPEFVGGGVAVRLRGLVDGTSEPDVAEPEAAALRRSHPWAPALVLLGLLSTTVWGFLALRQGSAGVTKSAAGNGQGGRSFDR